MNRSQAEEKITYRELFLEGRSKLEFSGIEEADIDAGLLMEYVYGMDRNAMLLHGNEPIPEQGNALEKYCDLIDKRAGRIPLQHLTGTQWFMGLEFEVNEQVLIPRQDTEILVEEVLKELHDGIRLLDLCTGSGCILISLLSYSNRCIGIGTDLSAEAVKVAERNADRLLQSKCESYGILPADGELPISEAGFADRAGYGFVVSDLFENIMGKYDIIVSNPPYIRTDEIPTLMPEVREHDPFTALDGGEDGLVFYRKIIEEAAKHLNGGGKLFFEIGADQADAVAELMKHAGFREIAVVKDYAGLDRVISGNFW